MKQFGKKLMLPGSLLLLASNALAAAPGFDNFSVNTGTTGTLNGCPAGTTCSPLASSTAGFLQQEITLGTHNIPPSYVQTVIIDTPVLSNVNNVMATWIGQSVSLGGLGASVFGFQSLSAPTPNLEPYVSLDTPEITVTAEGKVSYINPVILGGYRVVQQDINGNETIIATSPADNPPATFGPFVPGRYLLKWKVPPQGAITEPLYATQGLNVLPLASFGPAVAIPAAEGSQVRVPIYLNGTAPLYPVTVDYRVSGDASYPLDHDATDGSVTITSGAQGYITFNIIDDGLSGEPQETIIFSLHSPSNAGLGEQLTQTIAITETHVAPSLELIVKQHNRDTLLISRSAFFNEPPMVTVSVDIQAYNPLNRYRFDWSETDNMLLSLGTFNSDIFSFDASDVPPGIYNISVLITDQNDPASTQYRINKLINVTAAIVPFTIPPAFSYTMPNNASIGWPNAAGEYSLFLSSSYVALPGLNAPLASAGLKLLPGSITVVGNKSGYNIGIDDLAAYAGPNGGAALYPVDDGLVPAQIVDFEVSGLTSPGQSIHIVIPQENSIPENPRYRKYMPHAGWVDFTENPNNALASSRKINGICPSPEDAAYTAGLTTGDNCIRLTIEDGGPNDADQQANSIIKDPGGVTTMTSVDTNNIDNNEDSARNGGGGGGSGLNLLWLLFALSAARGFRQSRRTC